MPKTPTKLHGTNQPPAVPTTLAGEGASRRVARKIIGFGLVLGAFVLVQGLIGLMYIGGSLTTTKATVVPRGTGPPPGHRQRRKPAMAIHFEADRLRLNWTDLAVTSPLGRMWQQHQNDCRLPLADFRYRNAFGLGSDLHVWTQALCNAVQKKVRIRTRTPWIYWDASSCAAGDGEDAESSVPSAMDCYFPFAEPNCPGDNESELEDRPKLYLGRGRIDWKGCAGVRRRHGNAGMSDIRASGAEFLFTRVSPLVFNEATRQLRALFSGDDATSNAAASKSTASVPSILVTVHIRWGDKWNEVPPRPVSEYVDAVHTLLRGRNVSGPEANVGIFLATEDPLAVEQFQREADKHQWRVYVDMYYQEFSDVRNGGLDGNPIMAHNLSGRPGLVALSSLLVDLQANDFVLTTTSNWSRLLNELRKNVLDPRCGNCTRMVDLQRGEW